MGLPSNRKLPPPLEMKVTLFAVVALCLLGLAAAGSKAKGDPKIVCYKATGSTPALMKTCTAHSAGKWQTAVCDNAKGEVTVTTYTNNACSACGRTGGSQAPNRQLPVM